ncbi:MULTISPECIES: DUF3383 domain-containing protein [Photorhabdus]|uniref:DUF3383 domain-containing protein n=2 Tax=Photorhabdus TaxID=29487 RepID=A0A7X5QHE9_9GAMM|nr:MULTISPECIES: DUF3383 domain-containing protein [Photorhabdus]KER03401.1 Protein of unknown function (DUF3383) [Photorhabdus temperata subsp. temperata Meg1]NHB94416.1 DUF3383 domain-containing protein [Photorhabdus cinerea]
MNTTIPASDIVSVLPGVIGAGGNALALNTVFITKQTPQAMLGVKAFGSAEQVAEIFGTTSKEHEAAQVYFAGFVGSTTRPETLYIASMMTTAQVAKLVGGKVPTRTDFSNIPQGLALDIDGKRTVVTITSADIKSYSALAEAVSASLAKTGTCKYDTASRTFTIEGTTKGIAGTIGFGSGDLAEYIGLTEEIGAQKNDGINADTIDELMPRITKETRNFVSIMAIGDFSSDEKLAISRWVSLQDNRYVHVLYLFSNENGILEAVANVIKESEIGGTCLMYGNHTHGAFACTYAASLNFNELNGRATFAFRRQEGLTPTVTGKALADELLRLGFNFYGAYGTANDRFVFVNKGSVSGQFKWLDSYVNQVYLNSQLQLALMTMLTNFKSIPYNEQGRAIHRAAIKDPIDQMLNFGAIQRGIVLSEQQKKQINVEAGFDAAAQIQTEGWCLRIGETPAQTRGMRKSMPLKLWYADGGSVQQVTLPSINIQ